MHDALDSCERKLLEDSEEPPQAVDWELHAPGATSQSTSDLPGLCPPPHSVNGCYVSDVVLETPADVENMTAAHQDHVTNVAYPLVRVRKQRLRRICRLLVILLATAGVLAVLGVFQKHLFRQVFKSRMIVKSAGVWGVVLVQVAFIIWVLILLPSTAFEVLVAFTFGFWISFCISMVGKTVGSIAIFCVARRFLAGRAERLVSGNVLMSTLLAAAERHIFVTICLVRMAYIPLAIKNVGLSVFPVSLSMYSFTTFLLNIPYAVCWCWLGISIDGLVDPRTNEMHFMRHWQATVAMGLGIAFTILLFVAGAFVTRRLAAQALQRRAALPSVQRQDTEGTAAAGREGQALPSHLPNTDPSPITEPDPSDAPKLL